MPRKVPHSVTEKENQSVIGSPMSKTKVKAERSTVVAGSSAKLNRVVSRVDVEEEPDKAPVGDEENISSKKTRGGTLTYEPGDEESENDHSDGKDDDDHDGNGSPSGRKRARINEAGDAVVSVKKEEKVKVPRRVTLPRDKDGQVFYNPSAEVLLTRLMAVVTFLALSYVYSLKTLSHMILSSSVLDRIST